MVPTFGFHCIWQSTHVINVEIVIQHIHGNNDISFDQIFTFIRHGSLWPERMWKWKCENYIHTSNNSIKYNWILDNGYILRYIISTSQLHIFNDNGYALYSRYLIWNCNITNILYKRVGNMQIRTPYLKLLFWNSNCWYLSRSFFNIWELQTHMYLFLVKTNVWYL